MGRETVHDPFKPPTTTELVVNGLCAAVFLVILFTFVGRTAIEWLLFGEKENDF